MRRKLVRVLRLVSKPRADASPVACADCYAHRGADIDTIGRADSVADADPDSAAYLTAHRSASHALEHADAAAIAGAVRDALHVGAVVRDDAMLELWRDVLLE